MSKRDKHGLEDKEIPEPKRKCTEPSIDSIDAFSLGVAWSKIESLQTQLIDTKAVVLKQTTTFLQTLSVQGAFEFLCLNPHIRALNSNIAANFQIAMVACTSLRAKEELYAHTILAQWIDHLSIEYDFKTAGYHINETMILNIGPVKVLYSYDGTFEGSGETYIEVFNQSFAGEGKIDWDQKWDEDFMEKASNFWEHLETNEVPENLFLAFSCHIIMNLMDWTEQNVEWDYKKSTAKSATK